jgi:hypothetical protein
MHIEGAQIFRLVRDSQNDPMDTLRLERFRYGDIHNSRSTGNEPPENADTNSDY